MPDYRSCVYQCTSSRSSEYSSSSGAFELPTQWATNVHTLDHDCSYYAIVKKHLNEFASTFFLCERMQGLLNYVEYSSTVHLHTCTFTFTHAKTPPPSLCISIFSCCVFLHYHYSIPLLLWFLPNSAVS